MLTKKKHTFFWRFLFAFLLLSTGKLSGQHREFGESIIRQLTAEKYHGRGYVKKGVDKSADYILQWYKQLGLQSFEPGFVQRFSIPVNTFPGKLKVKIDHQKLKPGYDYVVSANSPSIKGEFELFYLADTIDNLEKLKKAIETEGLAEKVLVLKDKMQEHSIGNDTKIKGLVKSSGKMPIWHVSDATSVFPYFAITMDSALLNETPQRIEVNIKSKYFESYELENIIGFIEGKSTPDSFIVFSAHYDHLGQMGRDVYFPGANDNASGVAMMLSLARYFSKEQNKPDCSLVFIAFSAEETGLWGSRYFVANPFFNINKIKILVNLDLVGTGEEGINIVNGKVFTRYTNLIHDINEQNAYLRKVKRRGPAANSDHFPFYVNGVPSFFIYTLGGITEYHNPEDKAETLPLTEFDDLTELLIQFTKKVSK